MTGMRRNEVLGLKWADIDFKKKTTLAQPRARRHRLRAPPDPRQDPQRPPPHRPRRHHARGARRLAGAPGRRVRRRSVSTATGGCSPTATANPSTPTPSPRPSSGSPAAPASRSSACTTCATPTARLLIKEGVPVKVVSERLGHANIAFTIQTYQHVLPGMQADAARVYERLTAPVPPAPAEHGGTPGEPPEEDRLNPVGTPRQRRRPRSLTWAFIAQLVAGEGFEPRPSGYEPDELPDCSTPRRTGQDNRRRSGTEPRTGGGSGRNDENECRPRAGRGDHARARVHAAGTGKPSGASRSVRRRRAHRRDGGRHRDL